MNFDPLPVDAGWSFAALTRKDTQYLTHGYHTYPAKFIPQLAARLIAEWSRPGALVADPFMGSGTTIVQALVMGRRAVGTDINPVAHLVALAKSTPLDPDRLAAEFRALETNLQNENVEKLEPSGPAGSTAVNDRIDYWFPPKQKERLARLLRAIMAVGHDDIRAFFLVAFSQILKSCSIWSQKSIKPTRDRAKTPLEPVAAFLRHARRMQRQNFEFWNELPPEVRANIADYRRLECRDARVLPALDGSVGLVVTSPPYVTSYEYADLHQLAALWFQYIESLPEFRRRFIGTAASERKKIELHSLLAVEICGRLRNGKKSREVENYFADMLECFQEMYRVLEPGGRACIVIGNTELEGVAIKNAEVFAEQMQSIGFRRQQVIKREIPSKILPRTRDPLTGKFTSSSNAAKVIAYPVEYILVMQKQPARAK